jgi:hypothetical protein
VNQHDVHVLGQGDQRPSDGLLTGVPAGDHHHVGTERLAGEHRLHAVRTVLRGRDNDNVNNAAGRQGPHGMHEHRDSPEWSQRLGHARTQTLAATGGRNQGSRPPELIGAHERTE